MKTLLFSFKGKEVPYYFQIMRQDLPRETGTLIGGDGDFYADIKVANVPELGSYLFYIRGKNFSYDSFWLDIHGDMEAVCRVLNTLLIKKVTEKSRLVI